MNHYYHTVIMFSVVFLLVLVRVLVIEAAGINLHTLMVLWELIVYILFFILSVLLSKCKHCNNLWGCYFNPDMHYWYWRIDLVHTLWRKSYHGYSEVNIPLKIGDHITVWLTSKSNSTLTSTVNITKLSDVPNGTVITCQDSDIPGSVVKSKTLHKPGQNCCIMTKMWTTCISFNFSTDTTLATTDLMLKVLSFTSAIIDWNTPVDYFDCVFSYNVQIRNSQSNKTHNTTTTATSLNVTGLTHGVEYTIAVYDVIGDVFVELGMIVITLDGKILL